MSRARMALAVAVALSGLALLAAFGAEWWGGLVPCALCLVERWPYRAAIALGMVGLLLPRRFASVAMASVVLALSAGAVAGAVHVGVERGWWPSPLPQCQAPRYAGGTLAQRLAQMPAHPSKSCDEPTYLLRKVHFSMAQMNMTLALGLAGGLAKFVWRSRRSEP